MNLLTLHQLSQAVTTTAAAFRCRTKLQPAGGVGDKAFPPTYAGSVYATEKRQILDTENKLVTHDCVLMDSVQSQANRMEEALQLAIDKGIFKDCPIPVLNVDFSGENLLNQIGRVSSLEAPHRVADAILRDSLLDGVRFRESDLGKQLDNVSIQNATALYQLCPTALIFGIWDSTGPKGGLGAKFQRALVSEIIGVNAQIGRKTSSRIDPLAIYREAGPIFRTDPNLISENSTVTLWTTDIAQAQKDSSGNPIAYAKKDKKDVSINDLTKYPDQAKPSTANHGNVTPDLTRNEDKSIAVGGVTFDYAEQVVVLSLPALRRLRFPINGKTSAEVDHAGRTVLAALALTAAALAAESGFDLRSRCLLWPEGPLTWELLETPGQEPVKLTVTSAQAISLLTEAIVAAEKVGLKWHRDPITLKPAPNLVALLKRSQEIAAKSGDTSGN